MPIRRIFPALAVASGLLLATSLARGAWKPGSPGPPASLVLAGFASTLLAHGVAAVALRRGRGLAEAGSGWPGAQANRNEARARPFAAGGVAFAALAAGAGVWAGASAANLVAASASLAFNLGAFVVESASVGAQARLLGEVEGRSGSG